ncbi:MAG: YhcH/YjgK/YiaL family protein [Wenyingzhuangia sp.]|jgi:YhcH/YjgK/YiaL family protein|uniref:YhcH/YjgK/YiaL family protein n=1 Tax=Wenyingzhuangia sp. TaxID=1964193 RepID=UPI00321BD9AB
MIVDKIDNWRLYFKNEIFNGLFDELKTYTLDTPDGVYKNHQSYYFKVMTYETKLESNITESHRKEVDIHILLSGNEMIKLYGKEDVEITKIYSSETDCQFYRPTGNSVSEIYLKPGYMAVLFPEDIHNPQYAVKQEIDKLKKIVVKIDEKLFS